MGLGTESSLAFLKGSATEVAPRLLGCMLERIVDGKVLQGRIVETEAYDATDAASHSYKRQTPRTAVLFGSAGHLYVYFTYGLHYCCNVVVGPSGQGAAVLIRAVEPLTGKAAMSRRRKGQTGLALTNGPAKFCQAFAIDKTLNGHDLQLKPLRLVAQKPVPGDQIAQTTRIGISPAKERLWRFYLRGNPYVSKP